MTKRYGKLTILAISLVVLSVAGRVTAGSLDPTNPPGPTMHTLEEIYQKVDGISAPRSLSATSTVMATGFYVGTDLRTVDPDLASENIAAGTTIFGIAGILSTNGGSAYPAPVAKTGQTAMYNGGDDGDHEAGVAWPSPRFTDNGDGTVKDNLTGLIWLKNANAFTTRSWNGAITECNTLNTGEHGLTDGSAEGDWRLPSIRELHSLVDYGRYSPALCNTAGTGQWSEGNPFTGVAPTGYYWSGTTHPISTIFNDYAYYVYMHGGDVGWDVKASLYYVWPVRGGE